MRGCIQVVLKLQQQVHRKSRGTGLERVVEDEVCDIESREKVRLSGDIQKRGIRHSIGGERARCEFREGPNGGASRTFPADRIGSGARAGCRGLDCECALGQQGIWTVPVLVQERCSGSPWTCLKGGLRLRAENVRILAG